MMTTGLGFAAYEGQKDVVTQALQAGVDWQVEGPYLLSSAIFGRQWEIAKDILRAGMPISDSTYTEIYHWADLSLLDELPPRPDIIEPLKLETQKSDLVDAVIDGDAAKVQELLCAEWVDIEARRFADSATRSLLHYAAHSCHLEVLETLLAAGAKVNQLTSDGHSALYLVARCAGASKQRRRDCFRVLRSHGAEMIPPAEGFFANWRYSRGAWRDR